MARSVFESKICNTCLPLQKLEYYEDLRVIICTYQLSRAVLKNPNSSSPVRRKVLGTINGYGIVC